MTIAESRPDKLTQFIERVGIPFRCDADLLAMASRDFGNLVEGRSQVIVQPRNAHEVAEVINLANTLKLPVTPRAGGGSQSGQSVSHQGITLDVSRLDGIEKTSDSQTITCGSGTTWRQLVAHLAPQGMLPCVMPLNLNLTVGGTLSAGGFGANSHCFGPVVANVAELEVVTGAGDRFSCSAVEKTDAFAASLGGLGRCTVMTAASLNLRPIRPQVRTYYLLYEDLATWLVDQQQLLRSHRADYIEGFCAASVQGLHKIPQGRRPLLHWSYGLHVGVEFDPAHPPDATYVLENLRYNRLLHTEDDETVDYVARYELRFQSMQASGAWQQTHPWFECLLPFSVATNLIPKILELLPPFFGDGHRVMLLAKKETPRLFMQPNDSPAVAFAILPTGIPKSQVQSALEALKNLNDLVLQNGGKRYLSGWLGMMNSDNWQQQFGIHYDDWKAVKQQFDPNHILRSVLFP
jgi:cytokinin dehydrogenase